MVAIWVICIIIAITTHRIILIGPESVPKWGRLYPGEREFYFGLYVIALGIFMIPIQFFTLLPDYGIWVSSVLLVYFWGYRQ